MDNFTFWCFQKLIKKHRKDKIEFIMRSKLGRQV